MFLFHFLVVVVVVWLSVPLQSIVWKDCTRNDLLYVKWDATLHSFTHSLTHSTMPTFFNNMSPLRTREIIVRHCIIIRYVVMGKCDFSNREITFSHYNVPYNMSYYKNSVSRIGHTDKPPTPKLKQEAQLPQRERAMRMKRPFKVTQGHPLLCQSTRHMTSY